MIFKHQKNIMPFINVPFASSMSNLKAARQKFKHGIEIEIDLLHLCPQSTKVLNSKIQSGSYIFL
jgi:hypothetical protein